MPLQPEGNTVKQKQMDEIIGGIVTVSRAEIAKALAPLQAKVSALETENAVLREAIKDLREKQTLAALTPDAIRRRYEAIQ